MFRLILAAILVAVICAAACGDTIVLKNGGRLYGKIIKEDDKEITIELPNKGEIIVPRKQVMSIQRDERTGPKIPPPSESPLMPAQPEKKKPQEGTEKKEEAAKPAPKEEKEEELDPELKQRIDTLVHQLGRNKSGFRSNARAELAKIGKPAVPALIKALESGNTWRGGGAAQVLGNIGDERATEPLIAQLRDTDRHVRKHMIEALRKIAKQNFGYDPEADASARDTAVKKWEEWWQKKKEEEKKRKEEEAKKKAEEAKKAQEAKKKEAAKKAEEKKGEGEKKEAPEEPPGE
jgi:hypothetical protein